MAPDGRTERRKDKAKTISLCLWRWIITTIEANVLAEYLHLDKTTCSRENTFRTILDRFSKLDDVRKAIEATGVRECGIIFGIDYSKSNETQGAKTFQGQCLHAVKGKHNPYKEVICILGECIEELDDDGFIPVYGFGASGCDLFPLDKEKECKGFTEVLDAYERATSDVALGGATSMAPLIDKAVDIVKNTNKYHILVICSTGQLTCEKETVVAIVAASSYPLSIIVMGVGDGPWERMRHFDDQLPQRKFDNFQFVDFHCIKDTSRNPQAAVALAALMEIPDQYQYIRDLKLLEKMSKKSEGRN
ncbi:uncharacterized protein LOC127858722 isoform X2 [Dreissena polymorpha]|uniref:uncharacterized protein LOC127858722 isoform X2 n=1 Tax=Dreissena polymorpha TaxID=45954 RepID=UPI002263D2E1|nr:uncharacterized protein LOC127858722 isoform X2 [Dreissena polymorpha]